MKIYSEITGKTYGTVDECLAAEDDWKERVERKKKEKEEKDARRKDQYDEMVDAINHAAALIAKYNKDYGNTWWSLPPFTSIGRW